MLRLVGVTHSRNDPKVRRQFALAGKVFDFADCGKQDARPGVSNPLDDLFKPCCFSAAKNRTLDEQGKCNITQAGSEEEHPR